MGTLLAPLPPSIRVVLYQCFMLEAARVFISGNGDASSCYTRDGLIKSFIRKHVVGAAKPQHLTDAVAAVDLKLSDEEMRRLEVPCTTEQLDATLRALEIPMSKQTLSKLDEIF